MTSNVNTHNNGLNAVVPSNMSNFKWDATTKTYGVDISPAAGNLLQLRDGKLYYGIEAPADTSNLYVSSSMGDDSNRGTKTSPLRTIKEAFARNNVGTKFNIYLYEDDVHEWRSSWPTVNGKAFTMRPYGPVFDDVNSRNPIGSNGSYRSKEIKRPTIRFIPDGIMKIGNNTFNSATVYGTNAPISSISYFLSLTFDLTSSPDLGIGSFHRFVIGTQRATPTAIAFTGCDFKLGNHIGLILADATCSLIFDNCILDSSAGNKFVRVYSSGSVNLAINGVHTGRDGQPYADTPPGKVPLSMREATPNTEYLPFLDGVTSQTVARTNVFTNVPLE